MGLETSKQKKRVRLYLLRYRPTGEYLFTRVAVERLRDLTWNETKEYVVKNRITYLKNLSHYSGPKATNKPMNVFSVRARDGLNPEDFSIQYLGTFEKEILRKTNPKIREKQLEIVREYGSSRLLSAHVLPNVLWDHPANYLTSEEVQEFKRGRNYHD